jgi:hypothetical protein
MIDFDATLTNIRNYRQTLPSDCGAEDQVSSVMAGVCKDVIQGQYSFDEDSLDAFSRSFVAWTKKLNLLVLA